MKNIMVNHTLKISLECKEAIEVLRSKGVKPDRFLREGGEKLVIEKANKMKRPKLVKIKDIYF